MGKSSRLTIVLTGARVFCLGMLALLLTLPFDSGAGAVTFVYNGFFENPLFRMPQRHWVLDHNTGCFYFKPPVAKISGRLLYDDAVHVRDIGSGTVKSFSTTFIYRLPRASTNIRYIGFMMVAAKHSKGTTQVHFMGLHGAKETRASRLVNNHESDDHTLGVELDTSMNREFNGHIQYQQIWIDYSEANNRMDIYRDNYKQGCQGKPARAHESKEGLDLSLLEKNMYIGFSTAEGIDSSNLPHICAWSFSNDGSQAPPIVIARDDSPAAPPLPPGPSPPAPPAISSPQIPSLPSPINVPAAVGGSLAVLIVLICLFSLCWYKVCRRPLRIFISHTGGPNGARKNFPSWLHQAMTSHRWSRFKFHVKPFLDVENCPKGLSFAGKILKELARFDVAVVVVTPDFFERHWPMTELIKFVEVQKKDREGRIRVLPLFYELQPDELKEGLEEGTWENFWTGPSEDNHPLQLQECRDAVMWLCKQTGIRNISHNRGYDRDYIDTILKEVDKILCDERSFAADLRWAMEKLKFTRSGPKTE